MSMHWQELLPADSYLVSSAGLLHDYDRKILTRLYQPLIGPICISLYMTLWSELEENRLWSETSSHYQLMNTIGLKLGDIYEARLLLEGIGLVNVYKKSKNETKEFIYELNPPLSPQQFFTDGMLNIYLYKKIGKAQFNRLKRFFCDDHILTDQYEGVTKSFAEVFSSDHLDSLYVTDEAKNEWKPVPEQQYIDRAEGVEPSGFDDLFDFDLLFAGMKSSIVPKKAFTPKIKSTIAKLAFLYGIDPLEMQKLVMDAVSLDDEIDEELLRKAARDWYQIERQADMPSLVNRVQPIRERTQKEEPKTKEQELIRHLETISPRERLMQLSGGAEPSSGDLKVVEGVMINQKLNPGVVNVLIEYVMLKTDMKFTKGYVEKLAGHWARLKVSTVVEAMELAKNEHRKYQDWAQGSRNVAKGSRKKAIREEVVPEWLEKKEEAQQEQNADQPELDAQKRELLEKWKLWKAGGEMNDGKD
ncbi:replication initiation and membrane attachment family protein [Bacillus sp. ISL-78]|nr:replication initiation and membrane attachment family protein [Bacillus sp. ISL-78]MBT2631052.1 replication initiation and membrane attachment family protein [Bacillus sp. ISL-101]